MRALLLLAIALAACNDTSAPDKDGENNDDTEAADDSETTTTEDSESPDDSEAPADTEPASETPAGLPANWSGTYSVSWNWVERDWAYPGPGERYDTIVDGCSQGTVDVQISDAGVLSMAGPIGPCTASPTTWSGIFVSGTVTGADTEAPTVTGDVAFGAINQQNGQPAVRTALPFTAAFSTYEEDPRGQLTLTGARSFQEGYYGENLSVTITLRPE